jgi:hypothetical protein
MHIIANAYHCGMQWYGIGIGIGNVIGMAWYGIGMHIIVNAYHLGRTLANKSTHVGRTLAKMITLGFLPKTFISLNNVKMSRGPND